MTKPVAQPTPTPPTGPTAQVLPNGTIQINGTPQEVADLIEEAAKEQEKILASMPPHLKTLLGIK